MAITCTLGRDNIIKLLDAVYKKMLTVPEGEVFNVDEYINYLYNGFEKAQSRDVALQYIQQVPYVIGSVEAQLGGDLKLNMPIERLREITRAFRNAETGLNAIEEYLGLTPMTPEQLAAEANYIANTPTGTDTERAPEALATEIGDIALKSRSIFSSTGIEFLTLDPKTKTAETVEIIDKDKLRIYNTISKIYNATYNFDSTLGNPVYQGQEITLVPVALNKLPADQMTDELSSLLAKMNSINKAGTGTGNVSLPSEVFLLVVSDREGNPVYFNEVGDITDKKNGKLVYQTLRDVRETKDGYAVTNMYGYEKIITPGEEANLRMKEMGYTSKVNYENQTGRSFKTLVGEVKAEQQEQAKQLFNLRQKLIKGEKFKLTITGASRGVANKSIKQNIRLNQIDALYSELATEILNSIRILDTPAYGLEQGEAYIVLGDGIDQIYALDRSDIQQDLADKIGQVLTSNELTPNEKFKFYSQFYAEEIVDIPNKTRRHLVYFDRDTGVLTFKYYKFTKQEMAKNGLSLEQNPSIRLDLEKPIEKAGEKISEVLMSGKTSAKGDPYAAKFDYSRDLIKQGTYSDYVNGEFVEKSYHDFLKQQDAEIYLGKKGGLPLFNSYIRFAAPDSLVAEVAGTNEEPVDNRSEIRKFKDKMVEEVLFAPDKSITGEVVEVRETKSKDGLSTYTLDVRIEGQEGTHKFYQSSKAQVGDQVYLEVKDVIDNGFLYKDVVKAFTEVEGRIYDMGSLAERDFKANEPAREPIPVQTVTAAKEAQEESLDKVEPFPNTVTEDQAAMGDVNLTNPQNTVQPEDPSDISGLIDSFELGRSAKLPNGVTPAQVEKAIEWWNNSPLSQYIKLIQAANIVNSDVYAKFVAAGARLITDKSLDLDGKLGAIIINPTTGGTMVDGYHEAWHVFSQLFLTKEEKRALYDEVRKLKPEYAKLSSREVEEMLAEDFRSYALNPKVIKGQTKRNTLFRRILNFLKKLFRINPSTTDLIRSEELATEGVAGELFQNLYFASKNPALLNNYTPLIDNVLLDELNRGIELAGNKNEDALTDYDSAIAIESIDSLLAEVTDATFKSKGALDASVSIITNEDNKAKFFNFAKQRFEKQIKDIQDKLEVKPAKSFNSFETLKNLEDNAVAILRTTKGDDKYVFLRGQVEDFNNLNLNTKGGERIKGELFGGVVEIIGDYFNHNKIKGKNEAGAGIIIVNTIEEAQAQFDAYAKAQEKLDEKSRSYTNIELFPDRTVNAFEVNYDQGQLLDNLRILQSMVNNWENTIKYFTNNSAFNIMTKKVTVKMQEEDPTDEAQTDPTKSQTFDKSYDVNLLDIADKEVVYILKSLFAVTRDNSGKPIYQYNKLGYRKLANYKKVWNAVVRATNSTKDPQEMYKNIVNAVATYPELQQLVESRLPNPQLVGAQGYTGNVSRAFDITTSFWSVFSLPRVPYMQLTVFKDGNNVTGVEVTNAATDIGNTIRKFENNFASRLDSYFTRRDENNKTVLKLGAVVDAFSDKAGNFISGREFEFLNAIGFSLDDIGKIKTALSNPTNKQKFGIDYIFKTVKDLYEADAAGSMTDAARRYLNDFISKPITTLKRGVEPGVIGLRNSFLFTRGSKQTQIDKIIELQNKFGAASSTFSVQNPERNRVNEHVNDSTLTVIADGINTSAMRTDMYRFGKTTQHLDPKMNPFAEVSLALKSMFLPEGQQRQGRSISVEIVAGTQTVSEDALTTGSNTTSLDYRGKLLQEFHTFLKSGRVELMRPGSKSSSFGWRIDGGIVTGAVGKKDLHLYVDIDSFLPNTSEENDVIQNIILPYLGAEVKRINIYKTNPEAKKYIGYNTLTADGKAAGESFNFFDGILTKDLQNEILEKVTDPGTKLLEYLKTDQDLAKRIKAQVKGYFTNKTNELYKKLNAGKFIDSALMDRLNLENLTTVQKEQILTKAYFYNYWIHNVETSILFLGDIAQYNHAKQELHKRISGLISNGPRIRTDIAAQNFAKILAETSYAKSENINTIAYNGYVNTAVMQEITRESIYVDEIRKGLTADYEKRYKNRNIPNKEQLIKERVDKEVEKYTKKEIKEADGQGYITFDAYRLLKKLQNKWSEFQENLYQKIVKGETVSAGDIIEMFPVYKLQNFGFVEGTVLPVTAMHKFALMPLIPSMIKGSQLENLHRQMMEKNVYYATFESGSKVGAVTSDGKADQIFEDKDQRTLKKDINFTINSIHAGFLKEAASVNSKYKGEVVFSTQLRKLILSGLYEHGKLINPDNAPIVNKYEDTVDFYTELLKYDLLEEIGYNKDGKNLIGKPDKFIKLIQENLERKDYPPHLLRQLKTNKDGTLNGDLSYFIDRKTIEKTILSIVEKRFVRQYVKGEPLVQVAGSLTDGLLTGGQKFENPTDAQRKQFMGSNNLPFYSTTGGKTTAMKVAIALQGDFNNLLNLKDIDGKPIQTIQRLNEMIKNEDWLNTEDNRKKITLAAVRIPVQGHNSMEFMEVYEFLDPAAGNLIMLPTEIVAKSGGDYDVDKLTTFFPNIDEEGNYVTSKIANDKFFETVSKIKGSKRSAIKLQMKAVQNEFIDSIRSILEMPENYASLIRPNDTYILKDLADELQDDVSTYDKFTKQNGEVNMKNGKKMISPTTTLEPLYNLSKHEENLIGKAVLGIAASENALSPLFDAAGGKLPLTYDSTVYVNGRYVKDTDNPETYQMRLLLPHNKIGDNISISDVYSADGVDRISDVYSQGMNGWVDVEKDEWIFYIQGNYEIAPTFLYLIKAGVPVKDAVYFVSQPMIREYAEQQRLIGSDYGSLLGVAPEKAVFTKYQSAKNVIEKNTPRYLAAIMESVRPDQTFSVEFRSLNYKEKAKPNVTNYNKTQLADQIRRGIINPLEIMRIYQTRGPKQVDIYFAPELKNKTFIESATFASSKAERVDGSFSTKMMKDIIGKKDVNALSNQEVIAEMAMFMHFYEIQKQLMGLSALKRRAKPDTTTFRNFQEIYLRDVDIDALDENSKLDQEFKDRVLKESIVSSLFDKSIITDIAAPMMDLVNNPITNEAIKDIIANRDISERFGPGTDGVVKFIDAYKDAIVTFIFQNYLTNSVDPNGNIITDAKTYRGVKVTNSRTLNNDAVYTPEGITINLNNIKRDFADKAYLVLSESGVAYQKRNGLKPFNNNEDPFTTEEQYIKYVLERAYLQEQGLKDLELNQVALMNVFNPTALTKNTEYSFTKMVLDIVDKYPGLRSEFPVLEQLSGRNSKNDTYLLTLNDRDVLDGASKDTYASNIRALGNPRIEKVRGDGNQKISRIFNMLPLVAVYQHGHGVTPFGLEQILPQDKIRIATENAGNLFKVNYWNKTYLDVIYDKLVSDENKNSLFKNFLLSPTIFGNPDLIQTSADKNTVDPEETIVATELPISTQQQGSVKTKPDSIKNVKEMYLRELGTFTFMVGQNEYMASPKKNDAGEVKFVLYKYDDNTKLFKAVKNPKTQRTLSTQEVYDFLNKNLPKDFIDFAVNLYENKKDKLGLIPSKTSPGEMSTATSEIWSAYLFQVPLREMIYGSAEAPIILTLDEVNKAFNELYSDKLKAGIEKYLKPFVRDELIKEINVQKENLKDSIENYTNPISIAKNKIYINDLETALAREDKQLQNQQQGSVNQAPVDQTTKSEPALPSIAMMQESIDGILKGTKVITNRTTRFEDGNYVMPNGDVVKVTYLGEATVDPKTDIVTITNESTGLVTTRTLDQFAKAEGYKDAADFKKRSILSQSFIQGKKSRFIYQVAPTGSTTAVREVAPNAPVTGSVSSETNPEVAEFNTYLAENDNKYPKEFNSSNGRRYILNENNLYDLVSPDGKTMYLRNMDLKTGQIQTVPEITRPATDKRKSQAIKDIREMIKLMDLDLRMAEDGYSIYELMEEINNATTMDQIEEIEEIIRKYTC